MHAQHGIEPRRQVRRPHVHARRQVADLRALEPAVQLSPRARAQQVRVRLQRQDPFTHGEKRDQREQPLPHDRGARTAGGPAAPRRR